MKSLFLSALLCATSITASAFPWTTDDSSGGGSPTGAAGGGLSGAYPNPDIAGGVNIASATIGVMPAVATFTATGGATFPGGNAAVTIGVSTFSVLVGTFQVAGGLFTVWPDGGAMSRKTGGSVACTRPGAGVLKYCAPTNSIGGALQIASSDSGGVWSLAEGTSVGGLFEICNAAVAAPCSFQTRVTDTVKKVGIFTGDPAATFEVGSVLNAATAPVVQFSSNNGVALWTMNASGVIGSSGTAPTIACSAGTGLIQVNSNNNHGEFIAGAAAANCTLTVANPWPSKPRCWCNNETTTDFARAVPTTTTLQCVSADGDFGGETIQYGCVGAPL